MVIDGKEHPIAFLARYLTRIELKYGTLSTLISIVAWGFRKLCQCSTYAVEARVVFSNSSGYISSSGAGIKQVVKGIHC